MRLGKGWRADIGRRRLVAGRNKYVGTTVDKALSLLGYFNEQRADIGLSELSRLSGFDKAAVLRMMQALCRHGFAEQTPETKKYRLGPSFLRFARLRELNLPTTEAVQPILDALAADAKETCHFSMRTGRKLSTIMVAESPQFTRVHIDVGGELPFTATASGLAILAFSDPKLADELAADPITYTATSPASSQAVLERAAQARKLGYSCSPGYFEDEVFSIGAPVFGTDGQAIAAICIATPQSRMTPALEAEHIARVMQASRKATLALGAVIPAAFRHLFELREVA